MPSTDKIKVLNEKGRAVWVTRDTLKGPDARKYRPIEEKGKPEKAKGKPEKDSPALALGPLGLTKKKLKGLVTGDTGVSDEQMSALGRVVDGKGSPADVKTAIKGLMVAQTYQYEIADDTDDKQDRAFAEDQAKKIEGVIKALEAMGKSKKGHLRRATIRLAATLPAQSPERRALLTVLAKAKAKTPEGAKKLYQEYMDGLTPEGRRKTKKKPTDFYDPKGGDEDAAKADKAKSKAEKGQEKTKEKQEKSKGEGRARQQWGRDDAKKVIDKGPEAVKAEVERLIKQMYSHAERRRLDPTDPGVIEKALQDAARHKGDWNNEGYGAYVEAILSKHKKNLGSKGEAARRKTKMTDMAGKHGLEDSDVDALRSFAKGKRKKVTDRRKKEMDDKEFIRWYEDRWTFEDQKTKEDRDRYDQIVQGRGGGEKQKQTDTQLKAEFMKNADPETRKRVQQMSPAEFKAMLAAIMDEEETGGGKKASLRLAAANLAASLPAGDAFRRDLLRVLSE